MAGEEQAGASGVARPTLFERFQARVLGLPEFPVADRGHRGRARLVRNPQVHSGLHSEGRQLDARAARVFGIAPAPLRDV